MLAAEVWTITRMDDGTAVLLRPLGAEIAVPIFIGENEAQAILQGLGEVRSAVSRPLTHDLLLELVKKGGFALYRAEVHELRDGICYARLLLTGREFSGDHPLILDARPADAIALAVRGKCPVFIAQTVADQAGLPVEFFLDAAGKGGPVSADTVMEGVIARREALLMELDQAVAAEEYERAAEIRDILALPDKEGDDGHVIA
jgi:bifunctional DNase/RNase